MKVVDMCTGDYIDMPLLLLLLLHGDLRFHDVAC